MPRKKKPEEAPAGNKGHNVNTLKKIIVGAAKEMKGIKRERQELNERSREIMDKVAEHGVPKDSFRFVLAQMEKDPEDRDLYMDGIKLCGEFLGMQYSLFSRAEIDEAAAQAIEEAAGDTPEE